MNQETQSKVLDTLKKKYTLNNDTLEKYNNFLKEYKVEEFELLSSDDQNTLLKNVFTSFDFDVIVTYVDLAREVSSSISIDDSIIDMFDIFELLEFWPEAAHYDSMQDLVSNKKEIKNTVLEFTSKLLDVVPNKEQVI